MSSLASPDKIWWKPLGKEERNWVSLALVWCVVMFAMMIIWSSVGAQDVPIETYRTTPQEFKGLADEFVDKYQVGTESGLPVVRPPAGSDVFLVASKRQWSPILELKAGNTYRIHASSVDLQHGLSLQPENLNFQVLPGYDYVITLTPDAAGVYQIVCNEYCGIGHHQMLGKIIVTE